MDDRANHHTIAPGQTKHHDPAHIQHKWGIYVGIDIGSTSSDVVALNDNNDILFSSYQRTKGKPIDMVRQQLHELFEQKGPFDVTLAAATGSAGRLFAELLDIPFINEVPAQAAAICYLYPQLQEATVIEMGGQDTKLIFLSRQQGWGRVKDFALNTVCAAGTGAFLDQQAQRLGIDIEDAFGKMALESKNVPRMAGRCSVFAKTDMIHLQQQATPTCDIIAGLCMALARNLKSNLGSGRQFVKPVIFTGGVAANSGVVKALENVFELGPDEILVPTEHFFTGAIGAVLVVKGKGINKKCRGSLDLGKIDNYLSRRGCALKDAPRRSALAIPALPPPKSVVCEHLLVAETSPTNTYLGVDVGSISTNVAVIDEQNRLLAKAYLMTAGRPLEAVRQGLDMVAEKVRGKVKILGAATTGSGRYLTGDFIGADIVINEITAQATGAFIVNPKVDTIFEIGGQDSKYISLKNGVVVDFEMNHACAAGTGSFLEEQAQRLGISINEEFADLAFKSHAPIKLGERCTVFMESDLLSYQQQGAETSELVAGLSYAIVDNYLNRVVGRRKIGDNICFQGGTAFNRAVWSAFEKVIGKPIMVPDHHEVTGAIGAAAIAAEYMKTLEAEHGGPTKSKFRGFDNLAYGRYSIESFTCEHCPNHCEIKKVQLPEAEPLYYGSRCDRYNLKKRTEKAKGFGAFEYRRQILLEYAGLAGEQKMKCPAKARIGIPAALVSWQLLPLFARFFKNLGFEVVLSGPTNKQVIRMGVGSGTAQPCFPIKVAYGHVAELLEREVDYIFLPSIVSMTASFPQNKHNQLCPYVQSFAYQARTAFAGRLGRAKILTVPIRLGEGQRLARKGFLALGKQLGASAFAVGKAIKEGFAAQGGFESALKEKGREILGKIGPNQKLFVLVARPYNGCDEGVNLRLPGKLAELGADIIPMDMLDLDKVQLGDELLHRQVYWSYGQKILRVAEIVKRDPRLFAVYLSNFSCGPDSFLLTLFKDIMGQKPCLQLEIDEHSADAGVITRLEAFLESLKHYRCQEGAGRPEPQIPAPAKAAGRTRRLYIPYMSDCSYGMAACFRAYGQPAEVMPIADESVLLQGRQFTSGKECLPCAITAGEMLGVVRSPGFNPTRAAFLMPGSCGPCRFGMYNCMHRLILRYAGVGDVPVISPNQDGGFYKEFGGTIGSSVMGAFLRDVWTAMVGIDLLGKVILRVRPFAKDARHAQRVYEESLKRWVEAAEKHSGFSRMRQVMRSIAEEFAAVELDFNVRKPKIGVVGEIYVRSHPFANMNIIARLEELGAACDLAAVAEWVYYTNFTRIQMAKRKRQPGNLFTNMAQDYLQHRIERMLALPLEEKFGPLAEGPTEHVIGLAKPYLHASFEGEAVLSVGKIVEYHHQGIGGVVNVMPFTCMPSTVVSSHSMRISADCGDMPILNLSFDGQEDSTLTTCLEAFVEQVASRQQANLGVSQLIAAP